MSNNIESNSKWHYVTTRSLKQEEVDSVTKGIELVSNQAPVLEQDTFEVKDSTTVTGSNGTQTVEKDCKKEDRGCGTTTRGMQQQQEVNSETKETEPGRNVKDPIFTNITLMPRLPKVGGKRRE